MEVIRSLKIQHDTADRENTHTKAITYPAAKVLNSSSSVFIDCNICIVTKSKSLPTKKLISMP